VRRNCRGVEVHALQPTSPEAAAVLSFDVTGTMQGL